MRTCAFWTAILASSTVWAQSKRYPPEPVDKDKETADKSKLWDKASNPKRKPYEDLMAQASEQIAPRTTDGAREAVKLLDQAIELVPGDSRAYRMRGEAHTILKDWAKCATDLHHGVEKLSRGELDPRSTAELRKKLGICQARAGKLGDAERTLAEAAATGSATGEVWMRLGEVRIALGKLEEALAALETAKNATDVPSPALVRFLLAGAYDRSRRPSEAEDHAQEAVNMDRSHTSLRNPNLTLITVGEAEYLMGLAYSVRLPYERPEHALVFFRQFLNVAPDSPWRKRAEDKIKELRTARLPEVVQRGGGNASLDLDVARAAVRKSMPAMRACMAKLPTTVFTVTITRVGPRTSTTPARPRTTGRDELYSPYGRSPYAPYAPPAGVTTTIDHTGIPAAPVLDTDAAIRCIEPLATKLALPAIREKDTYYRLSFPVVAP